MKASMVRVVDLWRILRSYATEMSVVRVNPNLGEPKGGIIIDERLPPGCVYVTTGGDMTESMIQERWEEYHAAKGNQDAEWLNLDNRVEEVKKRITAKEE